MVHIVTKRERVRERLIHSHTRTDNMVLKATIFRIALEKMVELRDKQFKDEVEGEILQQLGQTSVRSAE